MPTFRGSVNSNFDLFLQYGFDVDKLDTFLLKENMYSGFAINTIKFNNTYNTLKWVEYFFDKKFNFRKSINFNFGLSYLYRENDSFFKTNVYLNKEIYYNFIISFGYEGSISLYHNKIYLGINYLL